MTVHGAYNMGAKLDMPEYYNYYCFRTEKDLSEKKRKQYGARKNY
ncbi:hypothetical protein KDK_71800 [Dictyobacter kobayashii]|uniref:Uncharacterized protein n=1 Tax=Dictyobacter kobayashii TaxID=2014872 RepID=A0A402AW60_9CHLR|nr:hypothetical protein KDK_71800 [Dictyobacter kobayashii]